MGAWTRPQGNGVDRSAAGRRGPDRAGDLQRRRVNLDRVASVRPGRHLTFSGRDLIEGQRRVRAPVKAAPIRSASERCDRAGASASQLGAGVSLSVSMFRAHFGIFSRKWRWLSQKGWTRVQVMTAMSGVSCEQAALTRWRNSGDITKMDDRFLHGSADR